ncbi:hypothetical protein SNE40_016199 [Patella caerulea]|uniref:Uncharacterized protein n=1 Tax=Patella caerulea TaxID=87958 RepID=A0AAN8J9H4_PATCE
MALVRKASFILPDDDRLSISSSMSSRSLTSSSNANVPTLSRQLSRASITEGKLPGTSPRGNAAAFARRASIATSGFKNQPRSFNAVGKKVTSILRTKMAFKSKSRTVQEMPAVIEDIKELPKSPRFSSYLSPEAQFALMKGYEDVLHDEIAVSLPEYRPHLKRTRTPQNTIEIKKGEKTTDADAHLKNLDDREEAGNLVENKSNIIVEEEDIWGLIGDNRSGRRPSLPAQSPLFRSKKAPRCSSSRVVISRDRRLVLTYHLESAMDILDTVRHRSGATPISPRVQMCKRPITPVKDYNSWTNVWHQEFDCKQPESLHKFTDIRRALLKA